MEVTNRKAKKISRTGYGYRNW
ncbi:hypothetical protein [Pediococcus claussenii]|nr:hypothetical protein [Pediococcus claussenii]